MNLVERIFNTDKQVSVIPDSVWECEQLKPLDIKLYKTLLDYGKLIYTLPNGNFTEDNEPIVTVCQETLADRIHVSCVTIQACLKRLVSVGLITVERYRGFKRHNHIIIKGEFFNLEATEEKQLEKEAKLKVDRRVYNLPKSKNIRRVPIFTEETKHKMHMEKLRKIGGKTYREKAIIEIGDHYNMFARLALKTGGYRCLSVKEPWKHKNWVKFDKLYSMCLEKGWDAKLYVEVQFDRANKYWKNSRFKFPLPHMLCSDKAQSYFVGWLEEEEEKAEHETSVKSQKVRSRRTLTAKQQVMRDVIKSTELLSTYTQKGTLKERQESKALNLFDGWNSYSSAYLWSVAWFRDYVKEMESQGVSHPRLESLRKEFALYDKNKKLQEVILKTVEMAEKEFNIPENIVI